MEKHLEDQGDLLRSIAFDINMGGQYDEDALLGAPRSFGNFGTDVDDEHEEEALFGAGSSSAAPDDLPAIPGSQSHF